MKQNVELKLQPTEDSKEGALQPPALDEERRVF
jgi:hypothetical protein